MSTTDGFGPVPEPAIPDGRLLVEIEAWNGNLYLGLASELTPQEYRFQGGLNYARGFDIEGRLVSPEQHRARSIRLNLSPFGPDMRFGPNHLDEVGQLHAHPPRPKKPDFSGTLLVPEDALSVIATCLSSTWRYVHIWTFDGDAERASISAYSFSSTVQEELRASTTRG